MNKIIIPNSITALNILSGTIAIYISLTYPEYLYIASLLVLLSAVFDFLDGFIARKLNAQSEFGKQMDSLADLVSFGVAPTFIMFNLIQNSTTNIYLPFLAFVIVIFSAIRLAIFNITDQKDTFNGFPTPAFAIFIVSLPLSFQFPKNLAHLIINIQSELFFNNAVVLLIITLFFSILLVSNVKMFSLKFSNFKFLPNKIRYIFLSISILLLIIFSWFAIQLIIIFYIILSIFTFLLKK